MQQWLTYGLFLAFLPFMGCKKPQPVPESTSTGNIQNRHLEVTVTHYYILDSMARDSAVSQALIDLYITEEDRMFEEKVQRSAFTDSTGKVFFEFLRNDRHYVRVSHDILGIKDAEINTPDRTTSFLLVDYVD